MTVASEVLSLGVTRVAIEVVCPHRLERVPKCLGEPEGHSPRAREGVYQLEPSPLSRKGSTRPRGEYGRLVERRDSRNPIERRAAVRRESKPRCRREGCVDTWVGVCLLTHESGGAGFTPTLTDAERKRHHGGLVSPSRILAGLGRGSKLKVALVDCFRGLGS